jgi:hypothetical protein
MGVWPMSVIYRRYEKLIPFLGLLVIQGIGGPFQQSPPIFTELQLSLTRPNGATRAFFFVHIGPQAEVIIFTNHP